MYSIIEDWLRTDRLELVISRPEMAEEILMFYQRNIKHLEPWEANKEPGFYTLEYHEVLQKEYQNEYNCGRSLRLWIKEKGKSELIGSVNFTQIIYNPFLSCFVGYKIDQKYTRKGYMKEALKQAIAIAFEVYGLHRIEASIMPKNIASKKVLLANGFEQEGYSKEYLRINGKWEDHERYALINHCLSMCEDEI